MGGKAERRGEAHNKEIEMRTVSERVHSPKAKLPAPETAQDLPESLAGGLLCRS